MRGFFNKGNDNVRGNTTRITQTGSNNTQNIMGGKVIINGVDVTNQGSSNSIKGDGIAKTISVTPQDFDSIDVSATVSVDFTISTTSSIEITADSNLIDLIDLSYFDGTLDIGIKDNSSFSARIPMKVMIAHPHISAVGVSGSANAEIMRLKQDSIKVRVSGVGKVELWGEVTNADLKVSGTGDIDTTGLLTQNLRAAVSGVGNVKASASKSASAKVSGMGNITVHGNPTERESKCSGMGNIRFI